MFQVYLYMLSAFSRKFGQAGFLTIYQDYAMKAFGSSLTQSGTGGAVYGGTATGAVVLVMLSHALKMKYNKSIHLTISAIFNGIAIVMMTFAESQVGISNAQVLVQFLLRACTGSFHIIDSYFLPMFWYKMTRDNVLSAGVWAQSGMNSI